DARADFLPGGRDPRGRPGGARPGAADGAVLDEKRLPAPGVDLEDGADATLVPACVVDDLCVVESSTQHADPSLEQPLFVLRGVILEVLGEVAELARLLDCGDHLGAPRSFELGELLPQRVSLLLRQAFALYHFDLPPRRREVYTSFGFASCKPAA